MEANTSSITRATSQEKAFSSPGAARWRWWDRSPTAAVRGGTGRRQLNVTPHWGRNTDCSPGWAAAKFLQPESRAAERVPGARNRDSMVCTGWLRPCSITQTRLQARQASPRSWVTHRMGPENALSASASSSSS